MVSVIVGEKNSYEHFSDSEWLPRQSFLNVQNAGIVIGNKEKLRTVNLIVTVIFHVFRTNVLYRNDRLVTVHKKVRQSNPQPQRTLHFVSENRVLFVWVDLHVFYAGSSIQNASEKFVSCIHPPFLCKLRFSANPANKNLTELGERWDFRTSNVNCKKFVISVLKLIQNA
jgi:hypothetical protein